LFINVVESSELAQPLSECECTEVSYFFKMNLTVSALDKIVSLPPIPMSLNIFITGPDIKHPD